MNIKIRVIVAIVILFAICMMINMVRKKSLELRYALSWFAAGMGVLILDMFPGVMEKMADIMGIETPTNMMFFLGFCFSLGIIFVLTIAISRMSIRIKKMAQELALYEKEREN